MKVLESFTQENNRLRKQKDLIVPLVGISIANCSLLVLVSIFFIIQIKQNSYRDNKLYGFIAVGLYGLGFLIANIIRLIKLLESPASRDAEFNDTLVGFNNLTSIILLIILIYLIKNGYVDGNWFTLILAFYFIATGGMSIAYFTTE